MQRCKAQVMLHGLSGLNLWLMSGRSSIPLVTHLQLGFRSIYTLNPEPWLKALQTVGGTEEGTLETGRGSRLDHWVGVGQWSRVLCWRSGAGDKFPSLGSDMSEWALIIVRGCPNSKHVAAGTSPLFCVVLSLSLCCNFRTPVPGLQHKGQRGFKV